MTIAEWCLLGVVVLTTVTILPARALAGRQFDNAYPRDPGFYTPGFRARSLAAHQNGFEAFPFFAAAVLLAEMRAAPQHLIDALAVAFLLLRLAYIACYLGNRPTLRSLVWGIGFIGNVTIFLLPMVFKH